MNWYAKSQGWTRIIPESHPNAQAIDGIFRTPEGKYIFIEAKETAGKGNYMQKLGDTRTYGRQMSDEWISHHVEELYNKGVIDETTRANLKSALDSGLAKKQIVVYRTTGFSGKTITKGFADDLTNIPGRSSIDDVIIIGNGG